MQAEIMVPLGAMESSAMVDVRNSEEVTLTS